MQHLYTRWSFFGSARLGLVSRLAMLDGLLLWLSTFPFKLLMMLAPVLFWWTGASVIAGTPRDLLIWLAPSALATIMFMEHFGGRRVIPVMTDATQLLSAMALARTIPVGLARPCGKSFCITTKNLSSERITMQWALLLPLAATAVATLGGIWVNTTPNGIAFDQVGYTVNLVWSAFNVMVLLIAAAVGVDLPKRRASERFLTDKPATLRACWESPQNRKTLERHRTIGHQI